MKRILDRDLKFLRYDGRCSFDRGRRGRILSLERRFVAGVAVVIDVTLDECGAKPAHQGAPARVRLERTPALAVPFGKTE